MKYTRKKIDQLERKFRLNLINSITGIKPANLVGTRNEQNGNNLAIFSSAVHLGSNPPQIGLVMRPTEEVPRHTFDNINETGYYTINQVSKPFAKKAHYTSAKLERNESEFERMKLKPQLIDGFQAPFVEESAIKIGMKHLKSIDLPNKCVFIIGEIDLLIVPDEVVDELGRIDLSKFQAVGISGLNTYYELNRIDTFPYVRNNEIPDFE